MLKKDLIKRENDNYIVYKHTQNRQCSANVKGVVNIPCKVMGTKFPKTIISISAMHCSQGITHRNKEINAISFSLILMLLSKKCKYEWNKVF